LFERVKTVWTIVVAAFVNDSVETDLPAEQCAVAMRTVIFGFSRFFITIVGLKGRRANFAEQLRAFFSVVVVQILVRGLAERALFGLRNGFSVLNFDGLKRPAVVSLISLEQRPVVYILFFFLAGSVNGGVGSTVNAR